MVEYLVVVVIVDVAQASLALLNMSRCPGLSNTTFPRARHLDIERSLFPLSTLIR
jgi:hypothetical protein